MFVTLLQPINSLPIFLSHSILSYIQRLLLLVICLLFPPVIKSLSDPLPDLFSKSCLKMYWGFNNILVVSSIFHQNFMQSTMVWFCDLISLLSTDTWCCFSNWRCWSRDKFHTFTMRQLSYNSTQPSSPSQSPKLSSSSSPKSSKHALSALKLDYHTNGLHICPKSYKIFVAQTIWPNLLGRAQLHTWYFTRAKFLEN